MSEQQAAYSADLAGAIRHANDRLDWIEARQGPLPEDGFTTIETSVGVVRALGRETTVAGYSSEAGVYPSGLRLSNAQDQTLRRWPLERIRPKSVALGLRSLIAEVDALRERVAALEAGGNAMALAALSEGGEELSEDAAIDVVMAAYAWGRLVDLDAALAGQPADGGAE